MGRYFLNSLLVTVVSVVLILILASMAGYALSHITFRGSKATFLIILAAMMIPFQVIMVPFVKTLNDISMLNTYQGLIVAYVSQFLPFTIYFMTSYFARIPKEITEAARVDGNNIWGVFGRIMLPLGRPALLSMGILNALFCWNDILIALLVMQSPSQRTVMVGVSALRGQYPDNVPVYLAGVLLVVIPLVIVYLIFQRQITAGVTAGATKG
jgi:multiple sugar transport system permease protein